MNNREEIALAVLKKYGTNYMLLGNIFQDRTTDQYCLVDIGDRPLGTLRDRQTPTSDNQICRTSPQDSVWIQYAHETQIKLNLKTNLAHLFALLGQEQISHTTLKQIDNYQQVIYLISNDVGYDGCLEIAKFTQVFLSIGGIAVKVESAGIVHERDKWLANYNSQDLFDLYSLFVVLVEGDKYYYSCGMQNFGKADVMVELTEDINLAIYVLNVFNYYRLTEFPVLLDGQTFQPDLASPMYQMQWIESNQSETDDTLLYNPYGLWHLTNLSSS
ncbi:MAG: hypothetical protein ACRC2S_03845 [Waterburya sp.]